MSAAWLGIILFLADGKAMTYMNEKLELFKKSLNGKRITVLGIGVSNIPLIKFLSDNGACVTACDKKSEGDLSEEIAALNGCDVKYVLGEDYLEHIDGQIVFKTPGMRYDIAQLVRARENGSIVTSEMEVFFELCPCRIIAVTGSDGKTTTTTLISEILKREGKTVWLGGNIGNPLIGEIDKIMPGDFAVLELSSFQLHTMRASANVAVITNLSPNHLDVHKDMEEYIDAKKNIYRYQGADGKLILNYDNALTAALKNEANGEVIMFSRKEKLDDGVCLDGDYIVFRGRKILNVNDIKIPGTHNIENYMAAIAATDGLAGTESIVYVAKNFGGVEHRIEFVRELDGVKFYNDSIASSPTRTTAGLNSFNQKVILIAGGYDKHLPFDEFGYVLKEHVKELVLMGVTAPKIKEAAKTAGMEDNKIHMVSSMEKAVRKAKSLSETGDIVLLSPACASFDMFKNFMIRGDEFKKTVNAL